MSKLTTDASSGELAGQYGRAVAEHPALAHLRFGQWVCNTYLRAGETWPELFYANNTDAFRILDGGVRYTITDKGRDMLKGRE